MPTQAISHRIKLDARVRRTRDRLRAALRHLMQHKTMQQITVQEVLQESGVSRSAFYAHFTSTQDLLLTDMDEFLERTSTAFCGSQQVERILPVREFFSHVATAGHIRSALLRSDCLSDFFDLAREHFARGIGLRLSEIPRARDLPGSEREVLAYALAGALVSHLDWWTRQPKPIAADQMDQKFHALAWAAIGAAKAVVPSR